MAIDEHALITLIATGNQDALRQLYASYRPRLWRYLSQQLGRNDDWTEEVLQDVFLAVWTNAHSYRHEGSVTTWLFHIAHNKAQKAQRAHSRRAEGHLVYVPEHLLEHEFTAATGVMVSHEDAVMDRLVLAEAFQRLSSKHREVLELYSFQGFSLEEIAGILDIPIGTVKSRMSYARQALFKQLVPEQAGEEMAQ